MPGIQRDLAVPDPWRASLERSRARRARAARRRRLGRGANGAPVVFSVRNSREEVRDLALREPWELSLGRKQLQEIRRLMREGTQKPEWTKPLIKPAVILAAMMILLSLMVIYR